MPGPKCLGACNPHLGWNAPNVEACASQGPSPLHAGHFEAHLASFDGRNIAPRATSDDDQILVTWRQLKQCPGLLCASQLTDRGIEVAVVWGFHIMCD